MPLSSWTRITVGDVTIYVADRPRFTAQGLAGIRADTFTTSEAVYFLHIKPEWGDFTNEDHGQGSVPFDIRIAFLDRKGKVLAMRDMLAFSGRARPPRQTVQAIEARPQWFRKMGFSTGKQSPVIIRYHPHRSRDADDRYPHLCQSR